MIVRPFRGFRPAPGLAAKIASPPYDVVTSEQAREMAAGDPDTFLHVIRSEIDLDPSIDPHDDRVYAKAAENLRGMIEQGRLVRDERPAYTLYELRQGEHVQTGIVGAAAVDDYLENRIRRHEKTRPDKEEDRTRHMDALSANVGPVFLTYRDVPELTARIQSLTRGKANEDFEADDHVQHRLWVVDDPRTTDEIERVFRGIPRTYVADGHHRTASAVNVAKARRERLASTTELTGDEPCNFFLAVLFPASQVRILGYHRIVRDLNGLDPAGLLERIGAAGFDARESTEPVLPSRPGTFGMCLDGRWFHLEADPALAGSDDPVARLDVSILSDRILTPILGIGDPRTDERIDFAGGSTALQTMQRRIEDGRAAVAFSLYPTSLEQVMAVADEGGMMPPKSTWFEPKLRSGLVIYPL